MAAMHPVDYYSTVTKNCSGFFTEEEVKRIRAFYYAMCAEADAMLGKRIYRKLTVQCVSPSRAELEVTSSISNPTQSSIP